MPRFVAGGGGGSGERSLVPLREGTACRLSRRANGVTRALVVTGGFSFAEVGGENGDANNNLRAAEYAGQSGVRSASHKSRAPQSPAEWASGASCMSSRPLCRRRLRKV